jgi:TP901 family phage tail tape measure protein
MVGNIVEIIIAAKDLTAAAFTKVQTKMGALKGVATKLGGAIKAVVKAGLLIGGAAILAAIGGGIKAFADFEDAMANVRKTTGLSKEAIAELGDAIKIMAEEIPVSQTELAKIATIAGQLGISGKEDILSFTESVAMMSVAFEMSAEDVATAMAKLGTIYDIPIENTEKLGSAINVLGNTTAAKEADIINFAMSLGPTARLLGFTATEALAMGASMISIGVDANDAGTRLSRAFTMIGKNIGELSSFVGMAEEEFRKLFEERPMDALTMVVTKLSEVEGKLEIEMVRQ